MSYMSLNWEGTTFVLGVSGVASSGGGADADLQGEVCGLGYEAPVGRIRTGARWSMLECTVHL